MSEELILVNETRAIVPRRTRVHEAVCCSRFPDLPREREGRTVLQRRSRRNIIRRTVGELVLWPSASGETRCVRPASVGEESGRARARYFPGSLLHGSAKSLTKTRSSTCILAGAWRYRLNPAEVAEIAGDAAQIVDCVERHPRRYAYCCVIT